MLVLSLLVFVHEMGHFLTARKFGVKAEEFGMGLPPRAIGIQKFEGKWRWVGKREIQPGEPMVYSLNWIPVGGFVKIKGENGEAAADADSFGHKKIWQRTVILAAGVTMNVALCIFLLSAGFMIGMPTSVDNNHGGKFISEPKVQITEVLADYPAAAADLKAGDIIVSIDNMVIKSGDELKVYLEARENQAVTVKIQRGTAELEKTITVVKKNEIIGFGIGIIDVGVVRYPWYLAIREGVAATWFWFVAIIMAVVGLFKELFGGPSAGLDFAGPVGIAVMTGQAAKMGWIYVLQFTALLSLNLAIINILPFPALDGGRILFLAIEKIRDKAVDSKLENLFHNIGFILLMVLIVAITYRDLAKYGLKILQALGRLVGIGN
ncbi:MAG: RIP metalloprotease RseP [Candidatus Buchananbacteria bacterium]